MRFIIYMLLAVTTVIAGDSKPHLLKSIVSGGNDNATLGQVVAGYKKNFHVGIRIPKRVALSVEESNVNSLLAYPNPTRDGVVSFDINNIDTVQVTDVYGKVVTESMDTGSNTIILPSRGVFFVKIRTLDQKDYSTKVIFN